jgi:hypothetical protein
MPEMYYMVIANNSLTLLVTEINERLKKGWELQGGVSVIPEKYKHEDSKGQTTEVEGYKFFQAIVTRTRH